MWVRIAAHYPVWYEPAPLALYRVHGSSITADISSRRYLREVRDVIELNRVLLPPARRDEISREALEIAAVTAIRRAGRMVHANQHAAAWTQVREALRTSRSPTVLERLAFFGALWLRAGIKRAAKRAALNEIRQRKAEDRADKRPPTVGSTRE